MTQSLKQELEDTGPGSDFKEALHMGDEDIQDDLTLWIQQIAEGNRDAFEKLYRAYQVRIFRFLFRMLGEAATAEELTNDVMIGVWKGAAGFKGQSKPTTWLFGIAHHKALNELRRMKPVTVEVEKAGAAVAPGDGPEEALTRSNLRQDIQHALQQLSPEHREVMELTFYQGLSYQEIAGIMQCPVNTVKTRMFYAKKQLQQVLQKGGLEGELL